MCLGLFWLTSRHTAALQLWLHSPALDGPCTVMAGKAAVFFDEGPGYLFIRTLGNGVDGSASLVRNVNNGGLYVRKESLRLSVEQSVRDSPSIPREAIIGQRIAKIPGVYQARGWCRWQDGGGCCCGLDRIMDVTYWEFCNAGTISSFEGKGHRISEYLICCWLRTMLAILIDIHDAGIVHNDAHLGNWLLDQREGDSFPSAILADFGRASFWTEHSRTDWTERCTRDFKEVMSDMCELLCLYRNGSHTVRSDRTRCSGQLLGILQALWDALSRMPHDVNELHDRVRMSRIALKYHLQNIVIPPPRSYSFCTTDDFCEYNKATTVVREKERAFKQFKVAFVQSPGCGEQSIITITEPASRFCRTMNLIAEGGYPPAKMKGAKYKVMIC